MAAAWWPRRRRRPGERPAQRRAGEWPARRRSGERPARRRPAGRPARRRGCAPPVAGAAAGRRPDPVALGAPRAVGPARRGRDRRGGRPAGHLRLSHQPRRRAAGDPHADDGHRRCALLRHRPGAAALRRAPRLPRSCLPGPRRSARPLLRRADTARSGGPARPAPRRPAQPLRGRRRPPPGPVPPGARAAARRRGDDRRRCAGRGAHAARRRRGAARGARAGRRGDPRGDRGGCARRRPTPGAGPGGAGLRTA